MDDNIDEIFEEALDHIREQLADGCSLAGAIEHTAALYEIDQSALQYEWSLAGGA